MASQDWFEKDFYSILGVAQDADADTIKKTYRKLARKLHPDANPGDQAAETKFKEIGEAYAVLSDPEQRQQYDAIRSMAHGGARFAPGAGGPGGAAGFEDLLGGLFGQGAGGQRMRFSTGGAGADPNVEDILRMFGGAGGGFGGQQGFSGFRGGSDPFAGYGAAAGPRRGADQQAQITITFEQAAKGDTVTIGAGGEKVTTRIPAGVKDGQKIRLRGKGGHGDPGSERGDLMLTVHVGTHPVFSRDGLDLTLDLPVTFAEATLGATVPVPTLDGRTVKVKVAPGTPSGRVLRLKGRGIAAKSGTGDLLATVQVVVPTELTDDVRAATEALAAADTSDPRAELIAKAGG